MQQTAIAARAIVSTTRSAFLTTIPAQKPTETKAAESLRTDDRDHGSQLGPEVRQCRDAMLAAPVQGKPVADAFEPYRQAPVQAPMRRLR